MKKYLIILTVLCTQSAFAQYKNYASVKEVHVHNRGVVVSAHPLASEVGAKMLRMGGNAYDAAIATQFALAVVYPQAGNIGGGGFLVGQRANGEQFTIDYRETAPNNANRNMYLDAQGNANTDLSQNGHLAVGVPGSVAGLFATLKYAKLPMTKLIQPAIDMAQKGFAITQREAGLLNSLREGFLKYNNHPIAFVKDKPWQAGDILRQPELAATLKRIQQLGQKGFYQGATAQYMVAEMQNGKGIITASDLKNYQVAWRKPMVFDYKDYQIVSMPLPSSGGILLAQMLRMASYADLSKYQMLSPQAVQIMVEAERRAFADRAKYMGDPDFVSDPTAKLTAEAYLKSRWQSYRPDAATPSSAVGEDMATSPESTQTTHVSILDKYGNAVSLTTTLNGLYGSKVVVKGAGFFLNNEMDDFSVKPGVPNMYGAIGGEANAIAPKKRMLSSMTPTLVLKNNKPAIVVGTPGGTTIPTSVYQAIVDVIDFKQNANTAVNGAKFHHQWLPEVVYIERNFPQTTIESLQKMGYKMEARDGIGRTEMITIDDKGGIDAVADGRGDDAVAVE